MPQTFGVVAIVDKGTIPNLDILLAGIYERKGIDRTNPKLFADWAADKMPIIIDVAYRVSPLLRLKGFGYLITDVHNTYGVKADGKIKLDNGITISYLGEYAQQ